MRMPRRIIESAAPVFAPALLCLSQVLGVNAASPPANTGQIQGRVVDSSGAPVSAASVTAYRVGPTPAPKAASTAAANGSFSISGLGSGRFGLCVTENSGTFIDPCEWSDLQTTVAVTDGQTSSGVTVSLRKASTVNVQLNDPAQVTARAAGESAPPQVLVGVFDLKGIFHPARESKQAGATTSYVISIPVDLPVKLTVYSPKVKLQTAQQAPVAAQGWSQTIVIPSNQPQSKTFTFNTTGRNP